MTQPISPSNVASRALNTFNEFCQSVSQSSASNEEQRPLRYESLEDRCVLSANGLDVETPPALEPVDSQFVAPESIPGNPGQDESQQVQQQTTTIASLTVRVNEEIIQLAPTDILQLKAGDQFEVVDIALDSDASQGVFAAEGYLNKIDSEHAASLVDYNDGRFSQIADNFTANGGNGNIVGLSGSWVAETGWDRMTISVINYMENETTVATRALVQLQVDQADFAFDEQALMNLQQSTVRAGEPFEIFGAWFNNGGGEFHNYAEVDIYRSTNPDEIVWAGALVGNASADNRVEGYFENTREDDPFSEVFTPQEAGNYMFRFYLDPEHVVEETNEDNNQFDVKVTVLPANSNPVANDDVVETRMGETLNKIDLLANDFDGDSDELTVEGLTTPANGVVEINEDGTLSYEPDKNFVGTDEFQYSVTDGEVESEAATVRVEVLPEFDVEPQAEGDEDKSIRLKIDADKDYVTHVRISNVPVGAELTRGTMDANGDYDVPVKDLAKLKVTPPANSDENFTLTATPFNGETAYMQLSQDIEVTVNAVVDGGELEIADFAIVTGSSGPLPMEFGFSDVDESEQHTVTFTGLPDFVSLSAGEKVGDSWVLQYDELADLQIRADDLLDTSDFRSAKWGLYQEFDVRVNLQSVESSNADLFEETERFTFLAIHSSSEFNEV